MSEIAISAEGLSKRYRLGSRERYRTLRDTLTDTLSAPFRRRRSEEHPKGDAESFWALKDVSFEVKHGEVIGIIGRNGAGKSTLLKILSRITEPTTGQARMHGRVASLLEVGTGFHPELSGRDNIYLNGAILGMKKAEIRRKFDEIVDFAEVEKFIDTPVKHYSSGMYVRLAFAVAAHLEPEILILDEVLAVGDADFQQKCLTRVGNVASAGMTVLLVSHNLTLVRKICERAIVLDSGGIAYNGQTDEAINLYQIESRRNGASVAAPGVIYHSEDGSPEKFRLISVEVLGSDETPQSRVSTWDHIKFRIRFYAPASSSSAALELRIRTTDFVPVICCSTKPHSNVAMPVRPGINVVYCDFPCWPLAAGRYFIAAALCIPMRQWLTPMEDIGILETNARNIFGSNVIAPMLRDGIVAARHTWSISSADVPSAHETAGNEV